MAGLEGSSGGGPCCKATSLGFGLANPRLKADGAKAARFRRSEAAKVYLMVASLARAAPQLSRNVMLPTRIAPINDR